MTREEAIQILKSKMDGSVDTSYEWAETVRMAIEALNSVMDTENDAVKTENGLIKRQDAIDALGEEPDIWNDTEEEWAYRNAWVEHISALKALPSAEPEKIFCSPDAEWIPCSERLPDVGVEVLTTTYWSDVLIGWLKKCGAWETEEYILANDEILAWMPLPKPYREDGEA